ncbi:MAG: Holliday junction resolvase RuvX [Actinomycetota bacterium]|nr:Holliday junction resolvase RuvX [Actinomycetota bacterium]
MLAIDLGARRIGVAVSDKARTIAFVRPAILRSGDADRDRTAIVSVAADHDVTTVVVGLPLSLDGREGRAATAARQEAAALQSCLETTGVQVTVCDERFTTVTASRSLREAGKPARKARASVDSAAAAVLLQAWLEQG